MIQKKTPPQWTDQRSVRRCPLVASAEVTDLDSGTRLSARISELGVGGCYIDALTPFPKGTRVKLRIIRDQGTRRELFDRRRGLNQTGETANRS